MVRQLYAPLSALPGCINASIILLLVNASLSACLGCAGTSLKAAALFIDSNQQALSPKAETKFFFWPLWGGYGGAPPFSETD